MGAKTKKGKKKKEKKNLDDIPFAHPIDYDELLKIPVIKWTAELSYKIDQKAAKEGEATSLQDFSKQISGETPIDYSFNRIKEEILNGFGNSFGNLRLYLKPKISKESKDSSEEKNTEPEPIDLRNVMSHKLKETFPKGDENVDFIYDFEPFVHPMLEASVAITKDKEK